MVSVEIYLYATFVLTNTQFLNAEKAIQYAIVVVISLSIIRVLTMLL